MITGCSLYTTIEFGDEPEYNKIFVFHYSMLYIYYNNLLLTIKPTKPWLNKPRLL